MKNGLVYGKLKGIKTAAILFLLLLSNLNQSHIPQQLDFLNSHTYPSFRITGVSCAF